MREIVFRGKRIDNGEWLCGSYAHCHDEYGNPSIIPLGDNRFFTVIPETVEQWTGKTDKEQRDIFEGDLLKICGRVLQVVFDNGSFMCVVDNDRYHIGIWGTDGVEIIGNIHDNPELLIPPPGSASEAAAD